MTITLRNDYHDTEVRIRVSADEYGQRWGYVRISDSQRRRIERALCGIADCRCGLFRGEQEIGGETYRGQNLDLVEDDRIDRTDARTYRLYYG